MPNGCIGLQRLCDRRILINALCKQRHYKRKPWTQKGAHFRKRMPFAAFWQKGEHLVWISGRPLCRCMMNCLNIGTKSNHVLTRHEQGATHAAQGLPEFQEKLGSHCHVGSGCHQFDNRHRRCPNRFDAHCLHHGLKVGSHLLGRMPFRKRILLGISTPVTKWNNQITKSFWNPLRFCERAFYITKWLSQAQYWLILRMPSLRNWFSYENPQELQLQTCSHIDISCGNHQPNQKPFHCMGTGIILGEAELNLKSGNQAGIPRSLDYSGGFSTSFFGIGYGRDAW